MKTTALRAVPILGWLYLLAGLVAALLGRAPASRALRAVWWADALLSTVGHAAQIPIALAADELASRSTPPRWRSSALRGRAVPMVRSQARSRVRTAVMTQIFGLTWWRTGSGSEPEFGSTAHLDGAL
ncbi:hypothetical protein [Nocardia albiluteola]|uniref:hypothetical protein n=1 Tax=Nocardia albiluteola TaxID=2842303 RepID=UPI0027DF2ADB|nr:hypothetical protein [Nocardia albiluteola]